MLSLTLVLIAKIVHCQVHVAWTRLQKSAEMHVGLGCSMQHVHWSRAGWIVQRSCHHCLERGPAGSPPCVFDVSVLIFGLFIVGLLYMAYPDGCQLVGGFLLRLSPYPVRGHQLLRCVLGTPRLFLSMPCAIFLHCTLLLANVQQHSALQHAAKALSPDCS